MTPDGTTARRFDLPGANPTNCAFDQSDRLGLTVTEAEKGLLLSLTGLGPGLPPFVPNGALWPVNWTSS